MELSRDAGFGVLRAYLEYVRGIELDEYYIHDYSSFKIVLRIRRANVIRGSANISALADVSPSAWTTVRQTLKGFINHRRNAEYNYCDEESKISQYAFNIGCKGRGSVPASERESSLEKYIPPSIDRSCKKYIFKKASVVRIELRNYLKCPIRGYNNTSNTQACEPCEHPLDKIIQCKRLRSSIPGQQWKLNNHSKGHCDTGRVEGISLGGSL